VCTREVKYRGAVTRAFGQNQYQVRFDWGIQGADAICDDVDVIVVVDVLSFSTTVVLATELGVAIVPAAPESASELADAHGATLAGRRGSDGPTLSPASITAESVAGVSTLVLPSPNGTRLVAALADRNAVVVVGSLRNAAAIAKWALAQQGDKGDRFTVAIVAAGEVRSDGSIRFALEDLLGAGAIIDALAEVGIDYCSPEAAASAAAYTGLRNAIGHLVGASGSGRELAEAGFRADVDLAIDIDASDTVPVLREFALRAER
jgi:2-phosphosulfolactate phosphatase